MSLTPVLSDSKARPDFPLMSHEELVDGDGSLGDHDAKGGFPDMKSRGEWTREATATLLDAWSTCYLETDQGNLKQCHWEVVCSRVNEVCGSDKGPKSALQCRMKIDSLKKKYKAERLRWKGASRWEHYHRLDALVGNRKRMNFGDNDMSGGMDVGGMLATVPGHLGVMFSDNRTKTGVLGDGKYMGTEDGDEEVQDRRGKAHFGKDAALVEGGMSPPPSGSPGSTACCNARLTSGKRHRAKKRRISHGPVGGTHEHDDVDDDDENDETDDDPVRDLARAITNFGELYAKVEVERQRYLAQLEESRMAFQRDQELRRMEMQKEMEMKRLEMEMRMQLEIARLAAGREPQQLRSLP